MYSVYKNCTTVCLHICLLLLWLLILISTLTFHWFILRVFNDNSIWPAVVTTEELLDCRFALVIIDAPCLLVFGVAISLHSSSDCTVRYQRLRRDALIGQRIGVMCLKQGLDSFSTVCVAEGGGHRIHKQFSGYRTNQIIRRSPVTVTVGGVDL